jgi:hypothetical protein
MPTERAAILPLSNQRFTDLRYGDAEHGERAKQGVLEICDGRAARWGGFLWMWVTENNCYILMVTGSVSVKLRADSAGRTISLSAV